MLMSVKDVLKFAADEKAGYVNVRFKDVVGAWHHLTFPIEELSEKSFEEGFGLMVQACAVGLHSRVRHATGARPVPLLDRSLHGRKDIMPDCRCGRSDHEGRLLA